MLDDLIDRLFVDGLVNATAGWIHSAGLRLRGVQSGRLRQYVMLIVVGTVGLFILVSFFWNSAWAPGRRFPTPAPQPIGDPHCLLDAGIVGCK